MVDDAADTTVDPESPVRTFAPSKEQMEMVQSQLLAAKFGGMVTVLMQSEHHKNLKLSDLLHCVVPPLLNNQFRLAEAKPKDSGNTVPVGLILWARVSQEVHEKMVQSLDAPFELTAEEWTSGDNYWIIDAIGQQRFLAPLLTDLRKTDFQNQTVNYRVATPDGPQLKTFEDEPT
ncbi:MAG: toxin-activating lysine-acyltransferase [Methyloligellaceae bacterium]